MGVALGIFSYGFALRYGWTAESKFMLRRVWRSFLKAAPGLSLPVVILGGIFGGIFTPTEAAAVAVAIAVGIGFFVTRQLKLRYLPEIILVSSKRTSIVLLMVATSAVFGWYLTNAGIPQIIAKAVMATSDNRYVVMFWLNMMLIGLGIHELSMGALAIPEIKRLIRHIRLSDAHRIVREIYSLNTSNEIHDYIRQAYKTIQRRRIRPAETSVAPI